MQYYSDNLHHNKSIIIKAIPDKNNTTKIIYHNVFLNHIISEEMWGPNLASTRMLPTLIPIVTILLFGSGSCFIRMKTCLIHGFLILMRISIPIFLFGSADDGPNVAQFLKYFQNS